MVTKILKSKKGFSLIEVMVTMAIVALILGVAATVLVDNKDQKLNDVGTQMASSIKLMFNEAAVKGQYFQLKINLNDNTFSPEVSSQPFKIDISNSDTSSDKINQENKNSEETDTSSAEEEDANEESQTPPAFTGVDTSLLKEIKLPDGYKIKNVFFSYLPQAIESGETALHFFPNGWVDKMILNLCDENEEVFFSLETFSATGKSKLRSVYTEPQWERGNP